MNRRARCFFLLAALLWLGCLPALAHRPQPLETRVGGWEQFAAGRTSAAGVQAPENAMGLRACAYKTASGRGNWLNRDPIGENGGINLYNFIENDPVTWIDYWGLSFATSWGAAGAFVGGGGAALGSFVADAYSGGVNLAVSGPEVALGAGVGGYLGYAAGSLADYLSGTAVSPSLVPTAADTKSWSRESPNPGKTDDRGDHKNRPDGKRDRCKQPKPSPPPSPPTPSRPTPTPNADGSPYSGPPKDANISGK